MGKAGKQLIGLCSRLQVAVAALTLLCISDTRTTLAFAPIPLQDFCVADFTSKIKMNGLPCKDPSSVTADNFFYAAALNKPGSISKLLGSAVGFVTVKEIPGLNTQDVSVGRADYAPKGFIPPHYHPRATEVIMGLEGTLEVGFVTSYPNFEHFNKTLNPGDVFVVPHGLLHYQYNTGTKNAAVLFTLSGQNPGLNLATYNIFGAKPAINPDFLSAAFQLDKKTIHQLQANFSKPIKLNTI